MPEQGGLLGSYTGNKKFEILAGYDMKELVDRFHPAFHCIPTTGLLLKRRDIQPGLDAVSYLYNDSIEEMGRIQAVYTQKNRNQENLPGWCAGY